MPRIRERMCLFIVFVHSEKCVSRKTFLDYAYFDFCLDISGKPLIHPRDCVIVIRVLDLHDTLTPCQMHSTKKKKKRKKRKKNEEKSDPGPHGFTRPMDITRGLEQQEVPVAVHSLSPTTIDEISKIRILWSIFLAYVTNGRSATITSNERNLHETRRFRRRIPLRDAVMDARVERKRESETKRSGAQTGPNWLVLRAPECLAGLRVQVPWLEWGG